MLKNETIINKFIRTYGDIRPFKNGLPCILGKVGDSGLSFQPLAFYSAMLLKLPSIPKIEQRNPLDCLPEIKYVIDGQIVSWSNKELIECFRILDHKPFQELTVTISDAILPIMVTRDSIGIFLSPHVDKMTMNDALKDAKRKLTNYEIWQGGKFKYEWVKQFHPWSTLWLVECNDPSIKGTISPERMIACRNPDCNMEMDILAYYNIHYEKHPECTCTCNTFGCPMDCYRNRYRRAYETKMRELSNRKRFWRAKYT